MKTNQELKNTLHQIDHKGYPAYKQLKGSYRFPNFILNIDHVQGDPFAAPSKISIQVEGKRAGFPPELYDTKEKKIALQDYLLRGFAGKIRDFSFRAKGSGKSGLMSVSIPGQEILERTGCQIDSRSGDVILRMEIGFPANGRTINSRELEKILFTFLPQCVEKTLFCRKWRYSSEGVGRQQKTDEGGSCFSLSEGNGNRDESAEPWDNKRNGNTERSHAYRRRRLSWQVYSFKGIRAWCVQPQGRRRQGVCYFGGVRNENTRGRWEECKEG